MSSSPFTAAALRGAVDLSALKRPAGGPGGPAGPGAAGGPGGAGAAGAGAGAGAAAGGAAGSTGSDRVVVEGTDSSLGQILAGSRDYPVIVTLWSSRLAASRDFVEVFAGVVRGYAGRVQLVTIDVDANPGVMQALQVQAVPVSFAFIAGQPAPLFEGAAGADQLGPVVDQVIAAAAQYGAVGTVPGAGAGAGADGEGAGVDAAGVGDGPAPEPDLPPLHQAAFDAIESGDFDAATAAYEQALRENPADAEAKLGLAQVGLLQRTAGADPVAARAAAADAPTDVQAQILVADLDLLGGHVEDAFLRLIDTVRVTADADRNTAREHLVELFEVVGTSDERVAKARKSLMSALF